MDNTSIVPDREKLFREVQYSHSMNKDAMLKLFNDPKFKISEQVRKNMIQSLFD